MYYILQQKRKPSNKIPYPMERWNICRFPYLLHSRDPFLISAKSSSSPHTTPAISDFLPLLRQPKSPISNKLRGNFNNKSISIKIRKHHSLQLIFKIILQYFFKLYQIVISKCFLSESWHKYCSLSVHFVRKEHSSNFSGICQ